MTQQHFTKSILIFGAKDHIGSAVAKYIKQHSPETKIRLATHKKENLGLLNTMFPDLEAVVADFFDIDSLRSALQGIESVFQISPDVFHEDDLVNNMLTACEEAGSIKHIVRILGTPPDASFDIIPAELKKFRYYPAMQHLVARERYRDSGLPVTFVNVAGYYMDDFLRMFSPPLFEEKTIRVAFNKTLAWVDHVDVADLSAKLLLSTPTEYIGKTLDITGKDLLQFSEVAALFTKILGVKVKYDGDEENFYRSIKPVFSQLWGEKAPKYFMKYFEWETQHDHLFTLTHHVKEILGREPKSFAAWINEHREIFFSEWEKNFISTSKKYQESIH